MKRIIAITLLLCLLLSFAAPALAQTRPLRFLVNDNGEAAAWLKEHYPEIPSQNLHSDYDYSPGEYDSLTDRLLGELKAGTAPTCTCWTATHTTWPGCWAAGLWRT